MVRETVAIETLARAATVRMSGLLGTVVRLPFRLTDLMLLCFLSSAKKLQNPLEYWAYRVLRRAIMKGFRADVTECVSLCRIPGPGMRGGILRRGPSSIPLQLLE